jgi:hypothetical protein
MQLASIIATFVLLSLNVLANDESEPVTGVDRPNKLVVGYFLTPEFEIQNSYLQTLLMRAANSGKVARYSEPHDAPRSF